MTQEIAVIDNTAIAQAFATPSGIDVLIQRIKSEASAEVPDLTTKKGRDRIDAERKAEAERLAALEQEAPPTTRRRAPQQSMPLE